MSTEEFTSERKSVIEKNFCFSGTSSSVRKKPYRPRSLLPLVPLDLNEIKREIEEDDTDDDIISENCENIVPTSAVVKTTNINNRSCFSYDFKSDSKNKSKEIKVIDGVKKIENDSFDLDLSVLPVHTPAKRVESPFTNSYTAKTVTQKQTPSRKFDNFATPNTKAPLPPKILCSVPRNTLISNSIKKSGMKQNSESFNKLQVNSVNYLIINLLGRGASSNVYQCLCKETKTIVAIKCVSLENKITAQGYINEVQLLKSLQHCERIIKLYDYQIIHEEDKLFMVLEKGEEDLNVILKKIGGQKINIPVYMLVFYWMEMLQAVNEIHSNGVIHSDLKPSNFISQNNGLKLIDFGIASSVQNDMTCVVKSVPQGSFNYMSPEAFNNNTASPEKFKCKLHYKSDVWSLGCILYELVYKKTPFQHIKNYWTKLSYIMNPDHTIDFPDANWLPHIFIDTIKKCLQYNVRDRPSVEELIAELDHIYCN